MVNKAVERFALKWLSLGPESLQVAMRTDFAIHKTYFGAIEMKSPHIERNCYFAVGFRTEKQGHGLVMRLKP